jgi:hypothetical protein
MPGGKMYTPFEVKFICDNYKTHTDDWIGEQLGRNGHAIATFRSGKLKLVRELRAKPTKYNKKPLNKFETCDEQFRRSLFMEFMHRGKILLNGQKSNIDMDKLIGAFQLFENKVMQ